MSKRHTYSDTNSNPQFNSYADREPYAKSDSNAEDQANANAKATSYLARLKVSYSYFGTTT